MTVQSDQAPRNSRALTTLLDILRSGRPLIYLRSSEEGRVGRDCYAIRLCGNFSALGAGADMDLGVLTWKDWYAVRTPRS